MAEINVEYKEWATQKKKSVVYETIELYHRDIGTLRYINAQQFNRQFTLPNDAPRNAGETVTFEAFSFEVKRPEQNDQSILSLDVNMGRVGLEVKKKLKSIKSGGFMSPAELLYRAFLDGEQVSAIPLQVASISIDGNNVLIKGEQENPTFRDISRRYNAQDFPGLAESL